MSKNLKGKSYNEVMNEWAAQRSFLQRASSGMMRPAYGVKGLARVWGWTWRLVMFTGIPAAAYMGWMRFHCKSAAFTTQLGAETKKFLGAESVTLLRSRWDWDGELRIEHLKAKGSPANIFTDLEVANLSSMIKVPAVFKKDWNLKNVSCFSAKIDLRSGATAPSNPTAGILPAVNYRTAGWGVSPDFSKLAIDSYTCDKLSLTWGSAPSTRGGVTECKSILVKNGEGWDMGLRGGSFHQGWLSGLSVTNAIIAIRGSEAVIARGDFTTSGGGSGTLTGNITLGEVPSINAEVKLENIQIHSLLPDYFQRAVKATGQGSIKLSGSTNMSSGVVQDVTLTLQGGALSGIPVFKALELATGESQLAQPEITGGSVHFKSQGTQETGGILVEADNVVVESGTRMKMTMTLRHERKQVMATSVKAKDTIAVSTGGTLNIGLPPGTVAKLKPAIRQEFFTREDQGMSWMEVNFKIEDGLEGEFSFTKATADRIVELHYAAK